jgi:hypothetical protein
VLRVKQLRRFWHFGCLGHLWFNPLHRVQLRHVHVLTLWQLYLRLSLLWRIWSSLLSLVLLLHRLLLHSQFSPVSSCRVLGLALEPGKVLGQLEDLLV